MKIYRVLECSGSYEDYMEYRVGTYASKNRALEAKKQEEQMAKDAEKQALLCQECMACSANGEVICQKLCLSFKEVKGDKNDCANYSSYWEPSTYRIDEEEVIE